ncbi:MAG TPA: acyclic terpene utilization AtuA family protein, partial [Isosphaeraceae bacterium]
MADDTIRIGNGAGFWGDNLDAPFLLARDGQIDVLTLEYLAELTMAILAHIRAKDPLGGYVGDFPELLERLVPILKERGGPSIVTNAGGLNPNAAAGRCGSILAAAGLGDMPIAVVTGDDVLTQIPEWIAEGVDLAHYETGEPITTVSDRLVAANVYLGARPIADALAGGASLVITGRVADASLTLGPAVARFRWSWDDWDRLAAASAAGHVIECGAQATWGLWHEWDKVPDLAGVGYPIAEIAADGSSVITKPDGTGGVVSIGTISEQLVYEIDDPARYRTPDVDVDLASIRLEQAGPGRVSLAGTRGNPPGPSLKLSVIYRDGWTASGMV